MVTSPTDSSSPRQGVVLAAGAGTRLRPLTETIPKPLLRFFGRPLLDWSVHKLVEAGVARIAVNAFHLGASIAAHVEGLRSVYPEVAFHTSREPELLGTGGALRHLADAGWFEEGPFWVVNSDAVYESRLRPLLTSHRPGHAVLMVSKAPEHLRLRRLRAAEDGHLISIVEPWATEAFAFCGVTLADAALLRALPAGPSCLLRQGLLSDGAAPMARLHPVPGFFADTGTPERLADAHRRGAAWVAAMPAPLRSAAR